MNAADWLTAILTPITFGLVLLAELRHRRADAGVVLHLRHRESDGDKHRSTLMNIGSDAAMMFTVVSTSPYSSPFSFSMLRPGDDQDIEICSDAFDQDWLLIQYVNALDGRFIYTEWLPLNPQGPLGEIWSQQRRRHIFGDSRLPRIGRKVHPVGPGAGVIRTLVRRTKKTTNRDVEKSMSLLFAAHSVRALQMVTKDHERDQQPRSGRLSKLYKRVLGKVRS